MRTETKLNHKRRSDMFLTYPREFTGNDEPIETGVGNCDDPTEHLNIGYMQLC